MDHIAYGERVARENEIRNMMYESHPSHPPEQSDPRIPALEARVEDLERVLSELLTALANDGIVEVQ